MPTTWTGRWKGGRTMLGRHGETIYVLEKMVHGRRYTMALQVRNEDEADAELALFVRDPEAYVAPQVAKQQVRTRGAAISTARLGDRAAPGARLGAGSFQVKPRATGE